MALGALAGGIALTLLLSSADAAVAAEICNPQPKSAASFCIDPSLSLSSATAGDRLDIDLSAADTSTGFNADTNQWAQSLSLGLFSSGVPAARISPSADMPDGLRLAHSPTCTASAPGGPFSDCSAGHGTFAGIISGTAGFFDGYHEGSFGIQQVVNVADPGPGNLARYRIDLLYTIPGAVPVTQSFSTVADVAAQPGGGAGPIVIPTRYSLSYGTVGVDGTIKSLSLHLDGESSVLADGSPADHSYRAFSVGPACGDWTARAGFISPDARTVSLEQHRTVGGCSTPATGSTTKKTGWRKAALKACRHKHRKARKRCIRRAKRRPV